MAQKISRKIGEGKQKKVLSLVLCVAMMLSVMVVGAGAAFSDQSKIKNTEAVDACTALNIIGGYPDGSFKPEGNITRAEVTKMICVALNGGKNPAVSTNTTPTFSDVRNNANAAWAEGYIESCAAQGIVSGVGGGKFAPNGNVTGVQMAKMLLVALGYKSENEGFTGNAWATNVNVRAAQKGLYEGLETMDTNAALTRDNAAQMIWNALNAYEVEYKTTLVTDSKGQLTSQITVQDKLVQGIDGFVKMTLLEDKYETTTATATLTAVKYDDNDNTYTTTVSNAKVNNYSISIAPFDATKDYSDLMGQEVKVMYKTDKKSNDVVLLGLYATNKNKVLSGLLDDVDNFSSAFTDMTAKVDGTEYDFAKNIKVVAPNGATVKQADLQKYYSFKLVDNNKDDDYDYLVVQPFSVAQIDVLTSSRVTLSAKGNTTLKNASFDLKKDDVTLYDKAAEDDYVVVVDKAYAVSDTTEITAAKMVSGKVDASKGPSSAYTDVRVDGSWYSVVSGVTGSKLAVNSSYDLATVNGFVFDADKTAGSISAKNVLYVEKAGALTGGIADGVQAKVWFTDGTSQTVTVTTITAGIDETLKAADGTTTLESGKDYDIINDKTATETKKNDEIKNSVAETWLKAHSLYTFSEKNGEYTVEPIYGDSDVKEKDNNVGSYDKFIGDSKTDASTYVDDGKALTKKDNGTLNARFADDAILFVKDADGVKIVSGKNVNKWSKTPVTSVKGLADKTNGVYYISIGAISMKDKAKSDAKTYGFVLDVNNQTIDNTDYIVFTMWDGTNTVEDIKVEDKGDAKDANIAKYSFVSFDWSNQEAKEADYSGFTAKTATSGKAAITAFSKDDITFTKGETSSYYEFADTYFVIGVDTKNGTSSDAKDLKTAKTVKIDKIDKTYANAVYFTTEDGGKTKVEAVFIDVNGNLYTDKNGEILYTTLTNIDSIDLNVAAPVKDGEFSEALPTTTSDGVSVVSIKWVDSKGKEVSGKVAAGTYTAKITVKTKDGFKFNSPTVTVAGSTSATMTDNVISATFAVAE